MKSSMKSYALIGALCAAAGCGDPNVDTDFDDELLSETSSALSGSRGRDPLDTRAPLYQVNLTVFTDTTANSSTQVYRKMGGPNDPNQHRYIPADKLRVGMQGYIERNGALFPAGDGITCQVGQRFNGGDLQNVLVTTEGGVYSTCMANPDNPAVVGKPLQFAEPIAVGAGEQLNLYTRLEVLDAGSLWAPGTDPKAGVAGGLREMGSAVTKLAAVGALVPAAQPLAAAGAAFGKVLGTAADVIGFLSEPPHGPTAVCDVAQSLVPGATVHEAPDDVGGPLVRVVLTGRDLFEATKNGPAGLYYDLDYRPKANSRLCRRPHTRLLLSIRRVTATGSADRPIAATSGAVVSPWPDELDAFSVDANGTVIHDQRRNRLWSTGDAVPSFEFKRVSRPTGPRGPFDPGPRIEWYPVFAPHARLAAISRSPGLVDLFGVDARGTLVSTWRAPNGFQSWFPISAPNMFPPGAAVAATARNPEQLDVFAVANDGRIMSAYWNPQSSWVHAFPISPLNSSAPGAQIAAVSRSNDDLDVFVIGDPGTVSSAWWHPSRGWGFTWTVSPLDSYSDPGSPIAAVSRGPGLLDVFWIERGGPVRSIHWEGGWGDVQTVTDRPASWWGGVSVVARKVDMTGNPLADNDHMDVFSVADNGRILHSTWRCADDNFVWNPSRTRELGTSANALSAVAPWAGTIHVVGKRADGTLHKTWYEDVERGSLIWQQAF